MKIVAFCYCLKFIKKTFRRAEDSNKVREDWKYVAMVLDRLFLWIFTIAVIGKIQIMDVCSNCYLAFAETMIVWWLFTKNHLDKK